MPGSESTHTAFDGLTCAPRAPRGAKTCSEVVRRQARAQRAIVGRLLSETAREKQDDDDDEDDPNETVAAVPIAVARTAETATEATKQEDDEDYDEDGSERHDVLPLQSRNLN